jgi:hypothetical protein
MFVVAIPCARFGGKVKTIEVISSQPVASYFVIEDATSGGPLFSAGRIWYRI